MWEAYDNTESSQVVSSNPETGDWSQSMVDKYNKICDEIGQIWMWKEFDKIEWVEEQMLNSEFAKFLLDNPEALKCLRSSVDTIKKDKLSGRAWKETIKRLSDFLDNLANAEKLEKDYKKFVEKLGNPKKLHKMKNEEIDRVNLYLCIHEDKALEIYNYMKRLEGADNWFWSATLLSMGMKQSDIDVYTKIKESLKKNYGKNDAFIEAEYPGYKDLSKSWESLKAFIVANAAWQLNPQVEWTQSEWLHVVWNWEDINGGYLKNVSGSIIDREEIAKKFNEYNRDRITDIVNSIESMDFGSVPLDGFIKSADGIMKYNWEEFSADVMLQNFSEVLKSLVVWDFVSDTEKINFISEHKDDIFSKLSERKWD